MKAIGTIIPIIRRDTVQNVMGICNAFLHEKNKITIGYNI
jgi:hypothetical protein